jgi:transposase
VPPNLRESVDQNREEVERRKNKPLTATAIELGKVLGHYKMDKLFAHQIEDRKLSWWRRVEMIEQEAKWDRIYLIRTRQTAEPLSAADTVRGYKSLAQVERSRRSLKGLDLLIRPIRDRTEERVPAHIFLCALAYYVEWHLRLVWAPLLFEDEELPQERQRRDPVLPAATRNQHT